MVGIAVAVVGGCYIGLAHLRMTSGMYTGTGLLLALLMGWWVLYGEPEHEAKNPRWVPRRSRERRARRDFRMSRRV